MNYDTPIQFYLREKSPKNFKDKLIHRELASYTEIGVQTLIKEYGDASQKRVSVRFMNPLKLNEKQFTYFEVEGIKYSSEAMGKTYIRGVEF